MQGRATAARRRSGAQEGTEGTEVTDPGHRAATGQDSGSGAKRRREGPDGANVLGWDGASVKSRNQHRCLTIS